jgi:hypothetical protein
MVLSLCIESVNTQAVPRQVHRPAHRAGLARAGVRHLAEHLAQRGIGVRKPLKLRAAQTILQIL